MTNGERVYVIDEAIEKLRRGTSVYICTALADAMGFMVMGERTTFSYFPELEKHKPARVNGLGWFKCSEVGRRINILKTVRDEIQSKI